MKKLIYTAGVAVSMMFTATAADAAVLIVDVSGTTNASLDGSNAVLVPLAAGNYTLTFTSGLFQGFSRFSESSGCDANGLHCVTGFENSIKYSINGGPILALGDGRNDAEHPAPPFGPANGGLGPQVPCNGYYSTPVIALANAGGYSANFNLASAGSAQFFLYDDQLSDNREGVSLRIASSVPEPATWAMMLVGFGVLGAGLRRRKVVAKRVNFNFA